MKTILWIVAVICLISCTTSSAQDVSSLTDETSLYIEIGNYRQAEVTAEKALEKKPDELYILSQLDVSLNGQGKTEEANNVRNLILELQRGEKKADRQINEPYTSETSWARIIEHHENYVLIASEYYTPQILRTPPLESVIKIYYKCIIIPKYGNKTVRVFKLEHSNFSFGDYYTLRESLSNGGAQRVIYGSYKPTIRQIATDTATYIDQDNTH